jgi:xanthine dehydrogenase FAD-binding subunit
MRPVLKPACLEELFALLEHHPKALIMAGGTDLLVSLRRQETPDCRPLLLLAHVAELQGISDTGQGLAVGAATTLSRLMAAPLAKHHAPLLVRAAATVGGPALRNMGTLGGNIRTASPAGDTLPALNLLGAEVELASRQGNRRVPVAELVEGPGRTGLANGEIMTRVLLPYKEDFPRQTFEKVGQRRSLAIAMVSFAGLLRVSPEGVVEQARFAWGSVAPTVARLPKVEKGLMGEKLDRETIQAAAAAVQRGVSPIDDIRATAGYRRAVAANLLVRFLEGARD